MNAGMKGEEWLSWLFLLSGYRRCKIKNLQSLFVNLQSLIIIR
jgi:hypothetical protein